ncbi:MAG: hydroxymethylglutaryl-CoA lyase [Actinomycetota bacterium]
MTWPRRVEITESSPRDGLQSLGAFVPTDAKIRLIEDLSVAGLVSFDAVSFVSPAAVPQMADGSDVVAGVARSGITLNGIVPNLKGLEAALDVRIDRIGVLTAASDSFNQRNINATVEESLSRIRAILAGVPEGLGVRAYISTATHCPYEGRTDPSRVAFLAETLLEWGCDEVFLGETIGKATVADVERLLEVVTASVPVEHLGMHLHDTYGQALANVVSSLERGIWRFDASAGGLGGCPYAPGASGNVATEDLMWLLDGLGIDHAGEIEPVARVAEEFCRSQQLQYRSRAGRALLAALPECP